MDERTNYWMRRRLGRRNVLRGAAVTGLGAGAMAVVGCGDDDDDDDSSSSPTATVGLLNTPTTAAASPTPSAAQPKPGGRLSMVISTAPPGLDPYTVTSFITSYMNGLSYSKLYRFKAGTPEVTPTDFTMEPDLATAMPETPEPTRLVFKLKPNIKFHNGRALTSEDIKYAGERYRDFEKSVHKSLWATVEKIETPDPQTVVMTYSAPFADAVQILGGNLGAYISPQEHAEGPDANTKMVGSGPFILKEFQSGVKLTFDKNPDYYDSHPSGMKYPFVDGVDVFITTDQAKRVADFVSKQYDLTWIHLAEERDQIKKEYPDAKFDEQQGIGGYIYMRQDRPPFNDKRVRQAMSMAINRKAIRDAISKGEGVPDQMIFVGYPFATQVKDLGDAAKYWDHNPTEARKLLDAALGAGASLDTTWDHADAAVYQQAYVDLATLTQAQFKEVGINVEDRPAPYAQYISTTYQGQYEGLGHSPRAVFYFLDYLTERLSFKDGKRARINLSYVNNPELETLLDKQRAQFDMDERLETVKEIEAICAEEQYEIYFSTDTRSYFWNPEVQNYRPTAWFPYTHLMKAWKEKA